MMNKTKLFINAILALTLFFSSPSSAFDLVGLEKIPGSSLDENSSGLLREICLEKRLFLHYAGRKSGTVIQLKEGSSPVQCGSDDFVVRKQFPVPSVKLDASQAGVIRSFYLGGSKVILFSSRNGSSTLIQVEQ